MAIPVYLWLKDDGGADIKGSVDVQDREGSIEVVAQEHNLYIPTDNNTGKLTGSELKSAVFAMSQSFNSAVPVEEQLRQLSVLPQNQSWPAALHSQTEQHLQQLITRYAMLKQKTEE